MCSNIISREEIIKNKLENVEEGELVLSLFSIAEELGMGYAIDFENLFSQKAMDFVYEQLSEFPNVIIDRIYKGVKNSYYIVELYLKYNLDKENAMGYEEFLNLVQKGKSKEIILDARNSFVQRINRLKRIISKTKRKMPIDFICFKDTRMFLKELDKDLSVCERYPNTSIELSKYDFGKNYGLCSSLQITMLVGFTNLEKEIYALYDEICIITQIDPKYVNCIYLEYVKYIGAKIQFNLFEKVMNNYLFAIPYSNPETLKINKVEAGLLIRECKLETIEAKELVDEAIKNLGLSGFTEEYLRGYEKRIEKRLKDLKTSNFFGELFIISPD